MKTAEITTAIITAYVKTLGADKWNALTAQQQHDAIMNIVKDMHRALDALA